MPLVFDVRDSALLRLVVAESRLDPFEFFGDGPYPERRTAKDEVEAFVRDYVSRLDQRALRAALAHHSGYLRNWVPDRLGEASTAGEYARLCAFAELHRALMSAEAELMRGSLLPPRGSDPVFDDDPELFPAFADGLMRLSPENIESPWVATNAVFFVRGAALFPHPFLAPYRELLGALADLVSDPSLRVCVAIDPYRRAQREELQYRLLEDYWDGMRLTRDSLDSLDGHDQGRSFHAAVGRGEADELFNPLLGTWFDWRARGDDKDDPVKRLYIREVKPPVGAFGRPELSAVINRELHAERDTHARCFTHVDGKVCRYPVEAYAPSVTDPRAEPGRPERARKLWRVDGPMSDAQWIELVGLFFRGNELIEEHFREAFPTVPASNS